jgi:hypothetical protein
MFFPTGVIVIDDSICHFISLNKDTGFSFFDSLRFVLFRSFVTKLQVLSIEYAFHFRNFNGDDKCSKKTGEKVSGR